MKNFLFQRQWDWKRSGFALGFLFLLAVVIIKPIGVSTQFVIADGIIWQQLSDTLVVADESSKSGYSSPNAYINKSGGKYAKNIAQPVNYSFIFVLAMIAGGFVAARLKRPDISSPGAPEVWQYHGKKSKVKTFLYAFLGGAIALFGARLAGGCTSGHMMSGMMQTAMSGYLFAAGAFPAAVITAIVLYRKKGESS